MYHREKGEKKMNTLIVTGSPRKGMFSDRIAEEIRKKTGGTVIHLREKTLSPCRACEYCHTKGNGECAIKDDMNALYPLFREAGTIVLVSPIYWWQVTAQMKTFIDRLYAVGHDEWKGKKAVVILNGGAEDDDVEFRILREAFSEMFSYLSVDFRYLGVGTTDEKAYENEKDRLHSFIEENF